MGTCVPAAAAVDGQATSIAIVSGPGLCREHQATYVVFLDRAFVESNVHLVPTPLFLFSFPSLSSDLCAWLDRDFAENTAIVFPSLYQAISLLQLKVKRPMRSSGLALSREHANPFPTLLPHFSFSFLPSDLSCCWDRRE